MLKFIKYIGFGILILIGIFLGPSLVAGFGLCATIGFVLFAILDMLGVIKIPNIDTNALIIVCFIIGLLFVIIYCSIFGFPK